jgi:predicted dehydrogenase
MNTERNNHDLLARVSAGSPAGARPHAGPRDAHRVGRHDPAESIARKLGISRETIHRPIRAGEPDRDPDEEAMRYEARPAVATKAGAARADDPRPSGGVLRAFGGAAVPGDPAHRHIVDMRGSRCRPRHHAALSNVIMPTQGLGAVIVGLGRAGLGLHIPVLEKVRHVRGATASPFEAVVGLVDSTETGIKRAQHRLEYDYGYDPRRISSATSIADLTGVDPDHTIVHICTPADNHASALRDATDAGFKRIVVEKPCAANTSEVDEMLRIAERTGASVAVVNPYLYSRSVASCKQKIQQVGRRPNYLEFEMSKPRITPTLAGRSKPESVMDVELPHQIATALHLTDPSRYRVLRAEVRHMHYRETHTEPCQVVPNMGIGVIVLELDECIAVLVSSLDALTRTRVLKLRFPNTDHIEAFLPVTGDDHTSVVIEYSGHNTDGSTEQQRVEKLPDDMLTRCLFDMYSRFATDSPQVSDLAFNRKVIDVMDKAKTYARIRR